MLSESYRSMWLVAGLLLVSCTLFLTLNANGNWDFILPLRATKLTSLLLVAYAVGVSTLLFQTLTNNPILTPSILGFDALYIFLQTLLVAVLGGVGYTHLPPMGKFGFELAAMVGGSLLLFQILLRQGGRDLVRMILIGVIFGILFRSLSSLLQRLIDPEEFAVAQAYTFDLPNVNHVLKPGHRLMVQIQSSLFPLYDRNPQAWVDNIFFAKPGDYRKATQRIWATPQQASFIELPVVSGALP